MRLILETRYNDAHPLAEPASHFTLTQYGFALNPSLNKDSRKVIPPPKSNIVILLRDAKPTLGSCFKFYQTRFEPLCEEEDGFSVGDDPEAFVRGEHGVKQFCRFLSDVAWLVEYAEEHGCTIKPVFYFDMFRRKFIERIPWILDLDWTIDPATRDGIFDSTRGLVNPSVWSERSTKTTPRQQKQKHNDVITPALGRYIDRYLREHCELDLYRKAFL